MGLNSIQRAIDHSATSNTTPLGANLKLIERARSNRGNTVCLPSDNRARCTLNKENLDLFNEESVSGACSGSASL